MNCTIIFNKKTEKLYNIVQSEMEKMNTIINKFNKRQKLTLEELENLFFYYKANNNEEALSDSRFDYMKFKDLYLVYYKDLEFKSTFYKRNPNIKMSKHFNLKNLMKINKDEYNHKTYKDIKKYQLENQLIIEVSQSEVQEDRLFLENVARDWANICLYEKHSDSKLITIAKETRDTLKKKNIERYLDNSLSERNKNDIFKGLLKSYFIHHEAIIIMESINSRNEKRSFILNRVKFEINHYSFVHILNRHFAILVSPESIRTSKSFHNTKIVPNQIHNFINNLISLLKTKGIENKINLLEGKALIIKFHDSNYALFFDKYKYDKSKFILVTFFIVENNNSKAKRLLEKIKDSHIVELDKDLSIYI